MLIREHRGFLPPDEPRGWRWWTALPLVLLVRIYQVTVSPVLGPTCRFYPSCSSYAVHALTRHGPFRGTWLTARRLVRCNPWNYGGVDHVPARHDHTPATLRTPSP